MGFDGFRNPPVGAQGTIARPVFKSENYNPGMTGWAIFKDGEAEFNALGGTFQITAFGIFFYTPNAGLGNLRESISMADGVDPYGNSYHKGHFINQMQAWQTGDHGDTVVVNPDGSLFPTLSFIPSGFLEVAKIFADGPNDRLHIDAGTLLNVLSPAQIGGNLGIAGSLLATGNGEFGKAIKARSLTAAMNVQSQTNTVAERQIGVISNCVPANDAVYESSYRVRFVCHPVMTGGGTVTIRVYVGSRGNTHRIYESPAVGGSGTVTIDANFDITDLTNPLSAKFSSNGIALSRIAGFNLATSIFEEVTQVMDTTIANDIEITSQFSVASVNNTIAGLSGFVTRNVAG